MTVFDDLIAAVFTPEDLADFNRAGWEEQVDKNIARFLKQMRRVFTPAQIAAGLERAVDDLWREVENQ